ENRRSGRLLRCERIELASADPEIWGLWNRPTITPSRTPAPDVRGALTWLAGAGFAVRSQRAGRTESFGNVLIEWERPPMGVQVVRDRGQWLVDVAAWRRGLPGASGGFERHRRRRLH